VSNLEFIFRTPAKILQQVFDGKIRGFYLTQDRPPISSPLLNPGGQTEILFDCHLTVSLGGGVQRGFYYQLPECTFLLPVSSSAIFSFLSALNSNMAMGRQPPQTPPEKVRHITLFLGNTLLDIFKRQLIATSVPHWCQKCGRKSA